jgi:hypothetical protein
MPENKRSHRLAYYLSMIVHTPISSAKQKGNKEDHAVTCRKLKGKD